MRRDYTELLIIGSIVCVAAFLVLSAARIPGSGPLPG